MNGAVSRSELDRFRSAIIDRIGLQFDHTRSDFLGGVLERRSALLGHSRDSYLTTLERQSSRAELHALARELTVCETHFYRNIEQFRALAEIVLPECLSIERTPRALRLLSAGCASGEEAYTIAIVARETIADPSYKVLIRAVDLNPAALERAAHARYSPWALRETPPEIQQRWFRTTKREVVLDDAIRRAVRFEQRNLASDDPELWLPNAYDVIFCRNVVMYFATEQMRAAVGRLARALAPGGYLFLGHAESLRGISDQFCLCHTHGTFYYRRKDNDRLSRPLLAPAPKQSTESGPRDVGNEADWVETTRAASECVAALVPASAAPGVADQSCAAWVDSSAALVLLREERFAEALEHVRDANTEGSVDALLLKAALLVQCGEVAEAEVVSRRLLARDPVSAGAHYVLALCCDRLARPDRAVQHFETAACLDPEFAMPRLHLGLLARRAGDRDRAQRDLTQALRLLENEHSSRLLLFGGGFGRPALISLCRSVLKETGDLL